MPAPTIYHFDPITGEYLSTGKADRDPMEEGNWLLPAHSTVTAPPNVSVGRAAVFRNGAWSLISDHRGEVWWKDGQSFTVSGLGNPAADGYTQEGPPAAGEHELVQWENGAWVVYIDRRGEVWWQDYMTPVLVDFLGDPAARNLTAVRPEPPAPDPEPEPDPDALPDLAPWQFRAMLHLSGQQPALEAFIDAMPEPHSTIARAKLEYTLVFQRQNDLVMTAQQGLGLSDSELDALWLQALSL